MARGEQAAPDVAVDLADAMRKNPKLKVFSANGYFDLATPFFATEYDLCHMICRRSWWVTSSSATIRRDTWST